MRAPLRRMQLGKSAASQPWRRSRLGSLTRHPHAVRAHPGRGGREDRREARRRGRGDAARMQWSCRRCGLALWLGRVRAVDLSTHNHLRPSCSDASSTARPPTPQVASPFNSGCRPRCHPSSRLRHQCGEGEMIDELPCPTTRNDHGISAPSVAQPSQPAPAAQKAPPLGPISRDGQHKVGTVGSAAMTATRDEWYEPLQLPVGAGSPSALRSTSSRHSPSTCNISSCPGRCVITPIRCVSLRRFQRCAIRHGFLIEIDHFETLDVKIFAGAPPPHPQPVLQVEC